MGKIKRGVYLGIGILCMTIGAIGIFIPVLPTVPFVLLAVFCFGKSSESLHRFILNNKYFGETVRRYYEGEGVTMSVKIRAILFLSAGIGFSVYKIQHIHSRIAMILIWIGVTSHILMLKKYEGPKSLDGNDMKS